MNLRKKPHVAEEGGVGAVQPGKEALWTHHRSPLGVCASMGMADFPARSAGWSLTAGLKNVTFNK